MAFVQLLSRSPAPQIFVAQNQLMPLKDVFHLTLTDQSIKIEEIEPLLLAFYNLRNVAVVKLPPDVVAALSRHKIKYEKAPPSLVRIRLQLSSDFNTASYICRNESHLP